jgi:CHAD domain-containing protein
MAKQSEIRGLAPDDDTRDAAVKTIWTLFEDMWAFRHDVLADRDIEGVHDMRVASRRLRTAMQMFKPCFGGRRAQAHYKTVKQLADLLGEVRDRDVLVQELEGDVARLTRREGTGIAEMIAGVRRQRDAHHAALLDLIRDLDAGGYDREFLAYFGRRLG